MIVLTFFMGLLTGVFGYFWLRNSDTETPSSSVADLREEEGHELLVTPYGGCARVGCPSLRLLDDGSYQYLAPTSVRDYARYEDTISVRQNDVLTGLVEGTDFESLRETVFQGTCPDTYDGLGYRFEIRYESDRYSFDSCVEDVVDAPLFVELVKYFGIMEAIHGSP
jgi:hypothetical protein